VAASADTATTAPHARVESPATIAAIKLAVESYRQNKMMRLHADEQRAVS
jgi:hypothetical protein